MKTELLSVDEKALKKAEALLLAGQVVAFPTETVYGLGAWAFSEEGIRRVYEAKGRPSDNPLIVHVAPGMDLHEIASEIPEKAKELMKRFWPGPLTLILPKTDKVPLRVTGGLSTVAIRMPSHPAAMELIGKTGLPIVAPSANTSGRPSPTSARHVMEDLQGKIPLILDGGDCQVGLESTIVDLTEEIPMILRPGAITLAMLEDAVGEVDVDPAVRMAAGLESHVTPKAPGMKYRHYAPKGQMILVEGKTENVIRKINELTQNKQTQGYRVGIIATDDTLSQYQEGIVKSIGSREHTETVAANLYRVLREMDESGADYIYSESFFTEPMGDAIMNRMLKAAGYRVISADEA